MPGEGPLGGLWTALTWATGVQRVVVLPCDMPRINASVVRTLVNTGDNATAAIGSIDGTPHPIVGCWPTHWAATIHDLLRSGERRMSAALTAGPFTVVEFDQTQMADADNPIELAQMIESARGLE